jgi:hypothetical protein
VTAEFASPACHNKTRRDKSRHNKSRHRPALDRATQYSRAPMFNCETLEYWIPAFAGTTAECAAPACPDRSRYNNKPSTNAEH